MRPPLPSSLSGRPAVAAATAVTAAVATAATNFEPAHVHAPLLVPRTFLLCLSSPGFIGIAGLYSTGVRRGVMLLYHIAR